MRIPEVKFPRLRSSRIGLQRLAKTESEHHASLTGSVFSIPTATLAYERFNCVL